MRFVSFFLCIFVFSHSGEAKTSLKAKLQRYAGQAKIFRVQDKVDERTQAEIERDQICFFQSSGLRSQAICGGISGENFDSIRHSLCTTYSFSEDAYMACMLNKNLAYDQIVRCWSDNEENKDHLACMLSLPFPTELSEEELRKLLDVWLFEAPKAIPPAPEGYEEYQEEPEDEPVGIFI